MDRVFGTHDTPPRPTPRARARRESRRKAAQTRTTTLGRPFWKRVCKTLVPAVGLEPTRGCPRRILNPYFDTHGPRLLRAFVDKSIAWKFTLVTPSAWIRSNLRPNCDHITPATAADERPLRRRPPHIAGHSQWIYDQWMISATGTA